MYTFSELQKKVSEFISKDKIGRDPFSLYDPINYTLESGGKRIRPILVLMASNLFTDKID